MGPRDAVVLVSYRRTRYDVIQGMTVTVDTSEEGEV